MCRHHGYPCISTSLFTMGNRPELYVLVQIVPQIYYYDRPPGRVHLDSSLEGQHKRAAQILVPVKVRIGIAGSAAIGGAALITSQANYNSLSKAEEKKIYFVANQLLHT